MVSNTIREKRATITAWLFAGAIAMYFEAIAIAAELRDYPGGPVALAKSIMPTIEGLRLIRWPADRLDTLGGYLNYHNVVLFNYFLAIFAATQGARLIRHIEENGNISLLLSTPISRTKVIVTRSVAYLIYQLIISLGLGLATAFALATSDEPNLPGSLITLLAGGICIFPFFGLGLLISQFVNSSRNAAGITSIFVTVIYVLGNIGDKYSWLNWIKYISPFHYANLSRPIIPGFEANYWSWLLMFLVGALFVTGSIIIASRRDMSSVAFPRKEKVKSRKLGYVPKSVIGDILWRQRVGLVAWILTSTIFIAVFISMMSGIIDIWNKFAFLQQFAGSGFGKTAEQQYLAMVYEILPPFLAGFVINQSSKWTTDLTQGRVQIFLATPLSIGGLILRRVAATMIGAELIIIFTVITVLCGSALQKVSLYPAGIYRVIVMSSLFALAFTSLSALLVAVLHGKNATPVVSIYLGAAWMIGFMVPYLKWPTWIIRLSIFDAFGHPFVKWPSNLSLTIILIMAIPGLFAALKVAELRPKVI